MLKKTLIFLLTLFSAQLVYASCTNSDALCVIISKGNCSAQGTTKVNTCWSYWALECEPCARAADQCNAQFSGCKGQCTALSTDQSVAECNMGATKASSDSTGMKTLKNDAQASTRGHEEKMQQLARVQQIETMTIRRNEKLLLDRQAKERAQAMEEDQKRLLLERQAFERQQLQRERMLLAQRQQEQIETLDKSKAN